MQYDVQAKKFKAIYEDVGVEFKREFEIENLSSVWKLKIKNFVVWEAEIGKSENFPYLNFCKKGHFLNGFSDFCLLFQRQISVFPVI